MKIIQAIKRKYHIRRVRRNLQAIAKRVFDTEWEKRKESGITKRQLADAIAISIVNNLNKYDMGNGLLR